MSLRSIGAITLLATAAWCAAPLAMAQDVTIKQVYQAAESGKFIEAQAMMDKVLREHPNSGKAHFIEAELLAKQGKLAQAGTELANAERLAPGLPFAKPEAVQKLRTLVAGAAAAATPATPATPATSAAREARPAAAAPNLSYERQVPVSEPAGSGIPWGMVMLVGGLAVAAFLFFRSRARGQVAQQQRYSGSAGPAGPAGMGGAYPQYANAGNPGNGPFGPGMGAPGGGVGSGIMGGLATGAALGAGMVAGQALMHRFTEGDRPQHEGGGNHLASNDPLSTPDPLFNNDTPPSGYDMGGDDFGVADPGDWDSGGADSGGGGGDEWN
ncbi:MAG: repeat-containing protein [Massilia sp.]|nr:repeat-containing protein [Massilia sp.]